MRSKVRLTPMLVLNYERGSVVALYAGPAGIVRAVFAGMRWRRGHASAAVRIELDGKLGTVKCVAPERVLGLWHNVHRLRPRGVVRRASGHRLGGIAA